MTVAGWRSTRLRMPLIGDGCVASTETKTASPVAMTTTRLTPSPRARISGFPREQKERTDCIQGSRRRTRRSQEVWRTTERRRQTTTEGPGTTGFSAKQPTQEERKGTETRPRTATPQEGRG
ncbi:hypothetical protein NDU88_003888 [Pleurodeles waltl]|uniref:Uncharacterized protein n=1 Tax=Pleurodeles waltl TaxID=8319 RepID=A0AAV7VEM6_PLEWA|nr:hypothetical protein NDU88_003888 [Pleurodeles waltl]